MTRIAKTAAVSRTMFDTPVIKTILHWLALFFLAVTGWKKEGRLPDTAKFIMVAAPHTSNWDLPVMLCVAFAFRARLFWIGKHTIFRRPFGALFRWMGGVPVDRSRTANVVAQMVQTFHDREAFTLVVAPEGTRKRTTHWKTGFYHIAREAGVPIVLGFLDYQKKVGGMGPIIVPSGDLEADMSTIREFYADITGCYDGASSRVRVRSES